MAILVADSTEIDQLCWRSTSGNFPFAIRPTSANPEQSSAAVYLANEQAYLVVSFSADEFKSEVLAVPFLELI